MRLTLALVLASGAVASASILGGSGGDGGGDVGASALLAKRSAHLRVHGKATGLYPGARKKLHVRVRNTSANPARLRSVHTKVRDASPGCARDYLRVHRKRQTRHRLPAHSRRVVTVRMRMRASAPDACQGATWPLDFRVRVRAHR